MVTVTLAIVCALATHLGLTSAVGKAASKVFGCTKCFTFWVSAVYLCATNHSVPVSLACAIVASYLSVWVEIGFVFLNGKYNELWERVMRKKE
jgi:hypothetical protein